MIGSGRTNQATLLMPNVRNLFVRRRVSQREQPLSDYCHVTIGMRGLYPSEILAHKQALKTVLEPP
jgi:hypothetical protein